MGTAECTSGLAITHFLGHRRLAQARRLHFWISCLAALPDAAISAPMRCRVAAHTPGWRLRFIQLGSMAKGMFSTHILYRVTDYMYLAAAWLYGRTTYDATTVRRRKG